MKKLLFAPLLLLLLASCHKNFDSFKQEFTDKLWATYPAYATQQGYHKYDSVLLIPDAAERNNELAFADWTNSELKNFKFEELGANDKTDYRMIQLYADGIRFNINDFKSYEWDPSSYNLGEGIFDIMDYKGESTDQKLRALTLIPFFLTHLKLLNLQMLKKPNLIRMLMQPKPPYKTT